ncbi:hypothetical protein M011DRAFT_429658, partial [Sporormia fimetaria CBS 119925]
MAFTGQTPEALLSRSDSKNPATTCKGITKLGRPCRNPLKLSALNNGADNGVLAVTSVIDDSDDEEIEAAAFFCHQHKDQAEQLVAANASANMPQRQDTRIYPLRGRDSIDTLVQRLGVLDVNDDTVPGEREKRRQRRRESATTSDQRPPRRRVNRPPTWDRVQGPLMEVPNDLVKRRPDTRRPRQKKPSFWSRLFCCGEADNEDHVKIVRHKRRTNPAPLMQEHQTSKLLSYIPQTLPPQVASQLLAELTKPISPHDEEGYIYIFWLTPESAGPAPSSTASSLLSPPSRPDQARQTSDILRQYSVRKARSPASSSARRLSSNPPASASDKETIMLKIGRANNVHRRMNEWTRQCGYSLSLVRFYPYVSARPVDAMRRESSGVRKVPFVKRVERLIHIELGEQRVMKKC